jgi:hypothetical protein
MTRFMVLAAFALAAAAPLVHAQDYPARSLWITACDPSAKPSTETGQLQYGAADLRTRFVDPRLLLLRSTRVAGAEISGLLDGDRVPIKGSWNLLEEFRSLFHHKDLDAGFSRALAQSCPHHPG